MWRRAAASSALAEGEAIEIVLDGAGIALFRLAGTVYATQAICTHAQAHLAEGYVEADLIECPLHAAQFHIPTGRAQGGLATIDLRTYPAREIDDAIEIELPS